MRFHGHPTDLNLDTWIGRRRAVDEVSSVIKKSTMGWDHRCAPCDWDNATMPRKSRSTPIHRLPGSVVSVGWSLRNPSSSIWATTRFTCLWAVLREYTEYIHSKVRSQLAMAFHACWEPRNKPSAVLGVSGVLIEIEREIYTSPATNRRILPCNARGCTAFVM